MSGNATNLTEGPSLKPTTKESSLKPVITQIIYGIVVQIVLFYICNIWLVFLPTPNIYFLNYTYLFSLYLTYQLSTLKKLEKAENLDEILNRIRSFGKNIPAMTSLSQAIPDIKLLIIIAAIYHIPTLFAVALGYIILSQQFGHQQTEALFHIPLLGLCSIFTICSASTFVLPIAFILSPIIFTLMFSDASLFNPGKLINSFSKARSTFWEKCQNGNPTDKLTLYFIITALITPFIQFVPFLSVIYPILQSPSISLFRFAMATSLVGESCHRFLTPAVEPKNLDKVVNHVKDNAIPVMLSFFTSTTDQEKPNPAR